MKKLDVKDFRTADKILDFIVDSKKKFPDHQSPKKLILGKKEISDLGLQRESNFFQIPLQKSFKSTYISIQFG